jgi:hypothetical protein
VPRRAAAARQIRGTSGGDGEDKVWTYNRYLTFGRRGHFSSTYRRPY